MLKVLDTSVFRSVALLLPGGEFAALCVVLISVGCVPDLQPSEQQGSKQCADGGQRLSYDDAPESLKTQQLKDAIALYSAMTGQWTTDVFCPPDSVMAKTLVFTVEARSQADIGFQPLCSGAVKVVAKCTIAFFGQDFPELAGQSSEFDAVLSPGPRVDLGRLYPSQDYALGLQSMNASYDARLDLLGAGLAVDSAGGTRVALSYGLKPYRDAQGGMTQNGYDCVSANSVRVGP